MTDLEEFEAHIKSAAWYLALSEAAKADDEAASVFRMAKMAASEAWQASRRAAVAEMVGRWDVKMEDATAYPSPSAKYPDLRAYHLGVAGHGEHAYNWTDKPHRLVYDLTRMVADLRDEIRAIATGEKA
jgi:hypothetical protein